jgi:hypothetical protein
MAVGRRLTLEVFGLESWIGMDWNGLMEDWGWSFFFGDEIVAMLKATFAGGPYNLRRRGAFPQSISR